MMQVCEIDAYGAPQNLFHLRERKDVAPGRGEVRVAMEWTSVNPIDCRRREGYGSKLFRERGAATFPIVLGCDVSGVVEAIGPGVADLEPGDPVFGAIGPSRHGTYASRCIVPAQALVRRPGGLAPHAAAALPYAFLTAWRGLVQQGGLASGAGDRRVTIIGASGGVGTLAIQIARAAGARVFAGASASRHALCRELGAEMVFDYRDESYPEADLVFQCGGGAEEERRGLAAVAGGGRFLTTVHPLVSLIDRHGLVGGGIDAAITIGQRRLQHLFRRVSYGWVLFRASHEGLRALEDAVQVGQVRPVIGARFDLPEMSAAHLRQDAGVAGKIVVACNGQVR